MSPETICAAITLLLAEALDAAKRNATLTERKRCAEVCRKRAAEHEAKAGTMTAHDRWASPDSVGDAALPLEAAEDEAEACAAAIEEEQ